MPRSKSPIPELKLHKSSGHGYARIDGNQVFLGKFGTPECRAKYERAIAEWLARDKRQAAVPASCSVSEVVAAFMMHAVGYYLSSTGTPTGEADNFRDALRPVRRLYGDLPAGDFRQGELKAVRAAMIDSGLSRSTINARINRVRRVWKWAASERLVPTATHADLMTIEPLRRNRTTAPEAPGIGAVALADVEAALPHMPRAVAAMVRVQLLSGCRVGEVLAMRVADLDRSSDPWEYRPAGHKGSHRGDDRVIAIGSRARAVLEPFLDRDAGAYLFDPRESARPGARKVRDRYDRRAYAQAIARACDRAFPHPTLSGAGFSRTRRPTRMEAEELKAWRKRHRWSPLQLRHAAASMVRREFGLEAAQAVLGHAKADTTQLYAERLDGLAREVARAVG